MDGFSLSDLPLTLLLVAGLTLLVGLPVYWRVRWPQQSERVLARYRLNRFTLLAVIFVGWAVEAGARHRWVTTAVLGAGALYFLWYSRRRPKPPITIP